MSRLLDEMAEDSAIESKKSLSTDNVGLKTIAEIAEKIRHKEDEIQYDEDQLKNKKEELRRLQNEELPLLMQEIGIKKFELEDGSSVNVKEIYAGSISQANKISLMTLSKTQLRLLLVRVRTLLLKTLWI